MAQEGGAGRPRVCEVEAVTVVVRAHQLRGRASSVLDTLGHRLRRARRRPPLPRPRATARASSNAAGVGTSTREGDHLPGDGVSLTFCARWHLTRPHRFAGPDPTARGAYPLGGEIEKSPRPVCKLTSTRFLTGSQPASLWPVRAERPGGFRSPGCRPAMPVRPRPLRRLAARECGARSQQRAHRV